MALNKTKSESARAGSEGRREGKGLNFTTVMRHGFSVYWTRA